MDAAHPSMIDSIRNMERMFPELWKLCYPRVFEEVGHFYSPKIPAAATFAALSAAMSSNIESMAVQSRMEVMTASKLVHLGMPMFFIAPALLAAIQQTVPPHELEWPYMKLPFEAAIFMLPKDGCAHRENGPCPYIAYSRWRVGETHLLLPGLKRTITSGLDTFAIIASSYAANGSPTYVQGFTADTMPKLR